MVALRECHVDGHTEGQCTRLLRLERRDSVTGLDCSGTVLATLIYDPNGVLESVTVGCDPTAALLVHLHQA